MYNFYDTSSLLLKANTLFEEEENIVISSITLQELEDIKTNRNKTPDIKFAARRLLSILDSQNYNYEVVIFTQDMLKPFIEQSLDISNDIRILASAYWYDREVHPDEIVFVTNDLALKNIANLFFGNDSIISVEEDIDDKYTGFMEWTLDDEAMADFYSHMDQNSFDCLVNEYVLLKNSAGEIVDKLRWTGEKYVPITYGAIDSIYFGKIKPYKGDPYQALLIDSFLNNKITLVKGYPGSGKSYVSLGYLFYLLDTHQIDKIIVICNTVAAKGSARLGLDG